MKKLSLFFVALGASFPLFAADTLFADLVIPPECCKAFAAVNPTEKKEAEMVLVEETTRLLSRAYKGADVSQDFSALWNRHQKEVQTLGACFLKSPEVAFPEREKLSYNSPCGYLPTWRFAANMLLLQSIEEPHKAVENLSQAIAIGKKTLRYPVSIVSYFGSIRILADSAKTLVLLKRRGELDAQNFEALAAQFPTRDVYVTGFAFALDGDYMLVSNLLDDSNFEKEIARWSDHRVTAVDNLNRDLVRKLIASRYQDLRRDFALGLPVQKMTVPADLGKSDREFLAFAMLPADMYNRTLRIVIGIDLLLQGKIGINYR